MQPFDPGIPVDLNLDVGLELFNPGLELWEDPEEALAYAERYAAGLEALPEGAYRLVKEVFDNEVKDLEVDKELAAKIHRYKQNFINRNKDHAAFFGGN